MKKHTLYCLLIAVICVMAGCGKSEKKAVKEFGVHFGEMVQNNDEKGIRNVYPDLGDYSSSHLKFYRDKVAIFEEDDGLYKVRYGDGAYIIVKTGLDGAMEVVESKGIFEKGKKEKEEKVATAEETVEKPAQKPQRPAYSAFNDGYNVLTGSFYYQGATYGFTVSFNYDTDTGRVSNAVYYADYNTSGAKNKINSMTISTNEKSVSIKGPGLSIKASGSPGSYSGSMTRGKHSGTCSMWL